MKVSSVLYLVLWFAMACLSPLARAEEAIPRAPYVAAIPENAHWNVYLQEGRGTPSASDSTKGVPAVIETVRTGDIEYVTVKYKDGATEQFARVKNDLVIALANKPRLLAVTPDTPPYPFYSEGFLFVEGLGLSSFRETVNYRGVQCSRYENASGEVWIATGSLLPVAARMGSMLAVYEFLPAPTVRISLSPEANAMVQQQERALNTFNALR
ncbi:MAG: hypothetical protein ACFUZC_11365 [Chthoniobacteraceae bacterium]